MASSHSSTKRRHLKAFVLFSQAYIVYSVFATIILIILAYKDVLYVRFGTDFLGESGEYSSGVRQLLFDGFSGKLLHSFFGSLPFIFLIILLVMVAYSCISTYRRTYESLNISKHFVNARRVPTSNIAFTHFAIRSHHNKRVKH